MTMKKLMINRKLALVVVLCAVTVCAVTAYAAVVSVRLALGTIPSSELFNGGPADMAVTQITMQPDDVIPWHYHPGRAYVVLKSGTVTEDSGCGSSEVFTAGQAFEEPVPRVHQVRNTGSVPAELYATIIVPAGQLRTINTGGPLCGPPANKDQCKDNGWINFNFPRSFENQGDCVSSVQSGK
jgi:quercetin dioxygenase-like cupin family protein